MSKKQKKKQRYTKVVDERFTLSKQHGGGAIKIEAWKDCKGALVKYNIAYINRHLYQKDNGRVIGYDNAHGYHHKHYFGEVFPVEDFESYENIVERFENEIKEYIK